MSSPQRGAPVTLYTTAAETPRFSCGEDKLVTDSEFLAGASTLSKVLSMSSAER
jgi:hypothetical protein